MMMMMCGKRLLLGGVFEQAGGLVVEEFVVLIDVADAARGQQLEPPLHLPHRVAQSIRRKLGLGDDGGEQVRDALVHAQFHSLRIDQDHAHLLRGGFVEDRHDHGIDGYGFAASRGAGDEHVGHGGQVGGDDAAVDVFAHG